MLKNFILAGALCFTPLLAFSQGNNHVVKTEPMNEKCNSNERQVIQQEWNCYANYSLSVIPDNKIHAPTDLCKVVHSYAYDKEHDAVNYKYRLEDDGKGYDYVCQYAGREGRRTDKAPRACFWIDRSMERHIGNFWSRTPKLKPYFERTDCGGRSNRNKINFRNLP